MASAKLPPRSSSTIWRGTYSRLCAHVAVGGGRRGGGIGRWASDTNGSAFFGGRDRRIAGPAGDGTATRARSRARSGEGSSRPWRTATNAQRRAGTRASRGRAVGGVGPRRDRPDVPAPQPGARRQQPQLPRREAGGPQVGRRGRPVLVADLGALVVHARVGVEGVAVLEPADLEVGGERRHGGDAAGPQRTGDAGEHVAVGVQRRSRASGEAEGALAQRDGGVELGVESKVPGIGAHEAGARWRVGSGDVDEPLADVDADDLHPPFGEGVGVPAGPAADVEHPLAGPQAEGVDQELDLLLGALGERVAEVGGAEVVGDRLEPVPLRSLKVFRACGPHFLQRVDRDGPATTQPLASAQLGPKDRLTSSGTLRSTAPVIASTTSSAARSCSAGGTSSSTSSCTWRMSRLSMLRVLERRRRAAPARP